MRALKVATVVMGVLIVVGTIVLVVLVVQRTASSSAAPEAALLDEPGGTRIAGVSVAADRVAVQLAGGGPDRVVVVDVRSGRVVGRIGLAR